MKFIISLFIYVCYLVFTFMFIFGFKTIYILGDKQYESALIVFAIAMILSLLIYYQLQKQSQHYKKYIIIPIIVFSLFIMILPAKKEETTIKAPNREPKVETLEKPIQSSEDTTPSLDLLEKVIHCDASRLDIGLYACDKKKDALSKVDLLYVYIDSYKGKEIDKKSYPAIYELLSLYKDTNARFYYTLVNNNQLYRSSSHYEVIKTVKGDYRITEKELIHYTTDKEIEALKNHKDVLTKRYNTLQKTVKIRAYGTVHKLKKPNKKPNTNNHSITTYDSDDYNVGDYSDPYDFFLDHEGELTEDEAYEIYENEYGE